MAGALTLVILVASGQAHDPGTDAVARGTREALGPETSIEVRETPGTPTDTDAIQVETSAHPGAVVEVRWNDARHDQAVLHVLVARTSRWVYRTIGFGASDAPAERGRTLGFAVASMLPEGGLPMPTPTPTPTPTLTPTPTPTPTPTLTPTPTPTPTPTLTPTPTPTPTPETPATHEQPAQGAVGRGPRFVVDVVGLGTLGVGSGVGVTAEGLGAAAAAQWFPASALSIRLGAGALGGTLSQAEATTLYLVGTAGLAVHPLRARAGRPFGVALRADYVVMRQSISRLSGDEGSPSGHDGWLSGVDGFVEGDWLFAPDVEVVLGVGLADMFAPTYVDVQGTRVATIPPLRALGEAGFRLRF
jgi:hypothetical protein